MDTEHTTSQKPTYTIDDLTYHDLSMDDHSYIKQQLVSLTVATFNKNPQTWKEWEEIVSPSVGWVSSNGKDYARVNLTKFGPGSRFWITIQRISPTELDTHVIERIQGTDITIL